MRKPVLILLAFCSLFAFGKPAAAAPILYAFTGHIDDVHILPTAGDPNVFLAAFPIGGSFVGTIGYDPDISVGLCPGSLEAKSATANFKLAQYAFSLYAGIACQGHYNPYGLIGNYTSSGQFLPGGIFPDRGWFELNYAAGTGFYYLLFNGPGGMWPVIVDAQIDSLTAVPEPASLFLLGSGIAVMAAKRRRRASERLKGEALTF